MSPVVKIYRSQLDSRLTEVVERGDYTDPTGKKAHDGALNVSR